MKILFCILSVLVALAKAETWFAAVQKRYETALAKSAYLVQFDSESSSSSIKEFKSDSVLCDYPSKNLVYDDSQNTLFYIATYFYSYTVNITVSLNKLSVGSESVVTLFTVQGSTMNGEYPSFSNLVFDKVRSRILFGYGRGYASTIAAVSTSAQASGDPTILYQASNQPDGISALEINEDDLYIMGYYNIRKLNLKETSQTPEVISVFGIESPFAFDASRNIAIRTVFQNKEGSPTALIVERPLSQFNSSSWYTLSATSDTVIYNSSWSGSVETFQDQVKRGYLMLTIHADFANSQILLLGEDAIYRIPYPSVSETTRPTLIFNVTTANPELVRVTSVASTSSFTASGFSVTITVLTSVALAAGAVGGGVSALSGSSAASAPSGASGAGAAATLKAQFFGGGMQLLQHPGSLLIALMSQLQFMVILGQLGGAMPSVYTQFVSGISWVMIGFKGASFGISSSTSTANDGMTRFAQVLKMSKNATFASAMIILIIIYSVITLIYFSVMALLPRLLKGKEEQKVQDVKSKSSTMICKLVGHLFLFSYLTLCTLSVYQLTIPDAAAGFFAGITLLLICSLFPIVIFLAVNTKPFPQFIESRPKVLIAVKLAQSRSKALFDKFFKDPLCSDFVEISYFMGFILIITKYLTGLFTGAVQSVPVFQVVLLLLVVIAEGAFVFKIKPYKIVPLYYIHLASAFLRSLSLLIKLGLTAANDSGNQAAGITILVLNGIMLMFMVLGVIVGMAYKNKHLPSLLKKNQVNESKEETNKQGADETKNSEGEGAETNPPIKKTAEV